MLRVQYQLPMSGQSIREALSARTVTHLSRHFLVIEESGNAVEVRWIPDVYGREEVRGVVHDFCLKNAHTQPTLPDSTYVAWLPAPRGTSYIAGVVSDDLQNSSSSAWWRRKRSCLYCRWV
jgi:hypothetical protein